MRKFKRPLARSLDNLVLQVGEHRGADFDRSVAAVVRQNRSVGKEHRVRHRKPQRIYILCCCGQG